ncbi:MAG: hypothetical protein ACYCXY_08220 [Acidimicrobiales bacterium]
MSIYEHGIAALGGSRLDRGASEAKAVLVENVVSKCGLAPRYTGLEHLSTEVLEAVEAVRPD